MKGRARRGEKRSRSGKMPERKDRIAQGSERGVNTTWESRHYISLSVETSRRGFWPGFVTPRQSSHVSLSFESEVNLSFLNRDSSRNHVISRCRFGVTCLATAECQLGRLPLRRIRTYNRWKIDTDRKLIVHSLNAEKKMSIKSLLGCRQIV